MIPTPASEFDRRIEGLTLDAVWREYYEPAFPARIHRQRILREALAPTSGEMLLDAGCGAGALAYWSSLQGARVTAFDYSLGSLRAAHAIGQRVGSNRPAYLLADATAIPFGPGRFDVAICVDVIDMLPSERHDSLLAELLRVVRTDGRVIVYTPNGRRESFARAIRPMRRLLGAGRGGSSVLHIGLIDPAGFRRLLRAHGVTGSVAYADMNFPWIARLPLLRAWLAGHMLWTIRKPE